MTATDEGSVPETLPPVELPGPGSKRPALASSERATDVLLGVVIAVSTGFYLALSRSLWFYSDDWAFLLRRGTVTEDVDPGRLGLWEPHNEHWSTGPILIYRALFEVFGLRHYTPYLVPVLLAHVALVLLAYRLLIRFGVRRWVAFAVATILAFNGAGAENILWPFQIGFVGALVLGFGALWLYDRHDVSGWALWPTWVALTVGLTFSSMGVVMVVLVSAYACCRRGVRGAVLVGSVPAGVFAVWFGAVGRRGVGATPQIGLAGTVLNLPTYVWTVLTHSWEAVSGIPGAGAVLVLVLLAAALVRAPDRARALAWAGTLAAVVLAVMIGVGRAAFGIENSKSSRYVYVVVALMAPILAVLLNAAADRMARPRWPAALLALGVLGFVVLNGAHEAALFRDRRVAASGTLQDRVLATAALARQGAPFLQPFIEEQENPDITTALLGTKEVQEQLPDRMPSPQGMLDAAAILQVSVSPVELHLPAPAAVHLVDGFAGQAEHSPGCHAYVAISATPTLRVLAAQGGGMIRLVSDSTQVHTRLQRGAMVSDVVTWTTTAGVPHNVGTSAADASLLVTLNHAGVVRVCQ